MLKIGSLVDNKYKILSEVGHGGMSVVYLAINERANKTWAIKEVRKDGVCDFEAVKQGLVVETDMLKKLRHPHLPSIIDVITTDDSFLIVMDYIEGRSLQSVLDSGGAQPADLVVEWGKQICDVLGYLHNQDPPIIYRDMKPANLMLKPDGNITLIDFGTAREFKNRSMVEDTTCLGTRGYAAPEQFGGRGQTDARTDIYCTGATLYHLLTGHSPAEPPYEIKPLSWWDPKFAGTGLEKVINRCCQQDPSARFQNCAELMYALEHVKDEDDVARRSRRRKWNAFVASVAVCLVGAAGMLGFSLAKNSASQETYGYYLDQALYSSSFSESVFFYKRAMAVDPGSARAYDQFLSEIAKGGMTQDEAAAMVSCFRENYGGTRNNLQYLKGGDPAAYDNVMYRIGILYFFLYDNSESSLSSASKYFAEVLSSDHLTEPQRNLAGCLYNIGSYYSDLGAAEGMYLGENTYMTLWQDLCGMVAGDVTEKVGGKIYCIALYRQMAYQINLNYENFNGAGVTKQEMTTQLDQVEAGLQAAVQETDSTELQGERDKALSTVAAARRSVNSYFDRKEGA